MRWEDFDWILQQHSWPHVTYLFYPSLFCNIVALSQVYACTNVQNVTILPVSYNLQSTLWVFVLWGCIICKLAYCGALWEFGCALDTPPCAFVHSHIRTRAHSEFWALTEHIVIFQPEGTHSPFSASLWRCSFVCLVCPSCVVIAVRGR